MITLITGIPGSGKTSYVVSELLKLQGRPIYADGIPDLAVEHQPCPPLAEWTHTQKDPSSASGEKISFAYPPNSVVVIDECQRVYRPRPAGSKVPPEVAAFETHRHEGLDFWLITQNPTLLDSNVRKLIGRHVHFRVTWAGRYMHEWAETADVESSVARSNSATTRYKLPKQAFNHYKSAVLHTKSRAKIPMVAYVFLAAVLGLGVVGFNIYKRFGDIGKPAEVAQVKQGTINGHVGQAGQGGVPLTPAQYVAEYTPRFPGLLHTAPAYDEITKPADAPAIAGCVERPKTGDCKCYDQQGNTYKTTSEICKSYMKDGMFIAWRKSESKSLERQEKQQQQLPQQQQQQQIAVSAPYRYGSQVDDLPGGSHNFAGGLSVPPSKPTDSFTIKPAG